MHKQKHTRTHIYIYSLKKKKSPEKRAGVQAPFYAYVCTCLYSILGRGSFCFNYCLNSAWHGGDQFVALLRWYGSPGFFDGDLQLICIFWSLVFHFPLDNTPLILYRVQVWWVCWPVKHTNTMVINQLLVLLAVWAGAKCCWKIKSAFLKSWSAEGSMKCSKISW